MKLTGNIEWTEIQLQKIYDAWAADNGYSTTLPTGAPNPQTKAQFYADRIDNDARAAFENVMLRNRAQTVTTNTQIAAIANSEGDSVL